MSIKAWIGIDSSTSCTAYCLIDETNNIEFNFENTKKETQRSDTYGESFDAIIDHLSKMIEKINWSKYDIQGIAIEANSFGGLETTMLLGVTIGIIHDRLRNYTNAIVDYATADTWRRVVLGDISKYDITNKNHRDELKIMIMNWFEQEYRTKLPLFENKSQGIALGEGNYDLRVNDVSDACGLAFAIKSGVSLDRKHLRIKKTKDRKELSSLKVSTAIVKKEVENAYKQWKKDKNNSKILIIKLRGLKWYLDELKKKRKLTDRFKLYYNIIEQYEKEILNYETTKNNG